jgi:hypothetical protein
MVDDDMRNFLSECSSELVPELPGTLLSGVGENDKVVEMEISVIVGFILVLLCLFLVVMTVKSFSSAISSRCWSSEEAFVDHVGFCATCSQL